MSEALWVTGDTLTTLRALPDGCVDLVVTSPPFLALRSYLPADDPAKDQEIGQEATPGEFLDVLLDVTEECARVLAPHGSLCVELGDTYSGSGGAGGDYAEGGMRAGQPTFKANTTRYTYGEKDGGRIGTQKSETQVRNGGGPGWPLAKSLCLIPELYRFALAYGFNPLTGRRTDPWRVRNVVRWCRPNPPVGALGDKFRPATSEMVVACKSGKRWFDLDAVREPAQTGQRVMYQSNAHILRPRERRGPSDDPAPGFVANNPAGAPPLDWWEIPTSPYKGQHYATFPERLCVRPIKAMCPLQVCTVCGEPRRRITKMSDEYAAIRAAVGDKNAHRDGGNDHNTGNNGDNRAAQMGDKTAAEYVTVGWTVCDCPTPAYRPGRVLDIFGGSGTTLAVAVGHGRDGIGIDLDARNADLARERIGPMFFHHLEVEALAARLTTDPPLEEAA